MLRKLEPPAHSSCVGGIVVQNHTLHAEEFCLWRFMIASEMSKEVHNTAFFREQSLFRQGRLSPL